MSHPDKKSLTETDIRTKFITPAIEQAGWDLMTQVREEVYFTNGRVIWKGKASFGKDAVFHQNDKFGVLNGLLCAVPAKRALVSIARCDQSVTMRALCDH